MWAWWGRMDSNHRRRSQRVYSPSPLATRAHPRNKKREPVFTLFKLHAKAKASPQAKGIVLYGSRSVNGTHGAGSIYPARTPRAAGRKGAWSWRQELNLQPTDYKSVALPLSYASMRVPKPAHDIRKRGSCQSNARWRRGRAGPDACALAPCAITQWARHMRICASILRLTRCRALSTAFV